MEYSYRDFQFQGITFKWFKIHDNSNGNFYNKEYIVKTDTIQIEKEIKAVIIPDPDAIDHSESLAGKIYKGKQLSIPLNYNKKVIAFQNFIYKCCDAFMPYVFPKDNGKNTWLIA